MTLSAQAAAALAECEEACPCKRGTWCSRSMTRGQRRYICFCSPAHQKPRSNAGHLPCKWPGHAAIARYGDLREQAAREDEQRAHHRIFDEAFNTGDGSYKP